MVWPEKWIKYVKNESYYWIIFSWILNYLLLQFSSSGSNVSEWNFSISSIFPNIIGALADIFEEAIWNNVSVYNGNNLCSNINHLLFVTRQNNFEIINITLLSWQELQHNLVLFSPSNGKHGKQKNYFTQIYLSGWSVASIVPVWQLSLIRFSSSAFFRRVSLFSLTIFLTSSSLLICSSTLTRVASDIRSLIST